MQQFVETIKIKDGKALNLSFHQSRMCRTMRHFFADAPVMLAFSWSILMSLNILFSNFWGIVLKEWKGANSRTITVLVTGLLLLVFSMIYPNL